MAYVSRWERLHHAVMRIMAACGLSKDEAQTDICRAIADGTVEIRGQLNRHTTKHLSASDTVSGSDLQIPTGIKSEHLDWERSRPVKPWMVRRGRFAIPGYWDLGGSNFPGPTSQVFCASPGSKTSPPNLPQVKRPQQAQSGRR